MNISRAASNLLADLRKEADGCTITDDDGSVWKDIYLPNAQGNRSRAQFAGLILALKDKGYYRPLGPGFGTVKL